MCVGLVPLLLLMMKLLLLRHVLTIVCVCVRYSFIHEIAHQTDEKKNENNVYGPYMHCVYERIVPQIITALKHGSTTTVVCVCDTKIQNIEHRITYADCNYYIIYVRPHTE